MEWTDPEKPRLAAFFLRAVLIACVSVWGCGTTRQGTDKSHGEEEDNKAKERIDKLNAADALVFQTEKQLKEYDTYCPMCMLSYCLQAFWQIVKSYYSVNHIRKYHLYLDFPNEYSL